MLIQKFREAENGFPKAFLLTSSTDAYRTIVRRRRQFPRLRAFFIVCQRVDKEFVYTLTPSINRRGLFLVFESFYFAVYIESCSSTCYIYILSFYIIDIIKLCDK